MAAEQNINPQDYELLSAYIDDELSDDERVLLEQRLTTDTLLQQELSSLRNTVHLIHQLPTMSAPRNFTLTPEMIQPANVVRLQPRRRARMDYLSLVASVLMMLFGVMFMLSELSAIQGVPAAANAPVQSVTTNDNAAEVANAPTEAIMMQSQAEEQAFDGVMFDEADESELDEPLTANGGAGFMPEALTAPAANEARSDDETSTDVRIEPVPAADSAESMSDLAVGAVLAETDTDNGFAEPSGEFSEESFGGLDMEAPTDDTELAQTLLYEASSEIETAESEPASAAGASFPETETTDEPNLLANSSDDTAEQESTDIDTTVDANGAGNDIVDGDAATDDASSGESLARRAVDEPSVPLEKVSASDDELTGIEVGIGLLGAGLLLLITSLWMIYRNRG